MKYLLTLLLSSLLINSLNCSFQEEIFTKMNKDKKGNNVIISPLSIFQALSVLANGAKEETLSQMLEMLESNTIDELNDINFKIISSFKEFTTMEIANAVMTRFTPLEDFSNIAEEYLAPVEPLESLEQVNNWCNNKTHGKIEKILDSLDPSTLMIILNAVYFKGEWFNKFKEDLTKNLTFYNLGKEEILVETMSQFGIFKYYEDKKVQAIELGFVKDFMTAVIILPSEETDINKYIDTLFTSNEEFAQITKGLKNANVHLQLPKFELACNYTLGGVLGSLGMINAFNPDLADLTGLRKEGNLFVNEVIHKTYLRVFEDGCEAAAVTAIDIMGGGGLVDDKIYEMKINRPFLFFLKNYKMPAGYELIFMSKIEKL